MSRSDRNFFEEQIVDIANMLAKIDCGWEHNGNWRLPCQQCIGRERTLGEILIKLIHDESIKWHIESGHDARDGNKPIKRGTDE